MWLRIVLICFTMDMLMADIDISKLKEGQRLESVEYANGKIVTTVMEDDKESSYNPYRDRYDIEIKPKKIAGKYGTIYRYNLTHGDKLLNVLNYDTLTINSNISNLTIGIVDKRYNQLDDNLKVTLKGNKIDLKDIYSSVDLMRLKYLVIIDKSNLNPKITSITFKRNRTLHRKKSKHTLSAWAWRARDIDITKIKNNHIGRTYLQMNSKFEDVSKKLLSENIELFGLNGSPNDIHDYQHLKDDVIKLAKLKKRYPNIMGYQLDVEPYLLKDFKNSKNILWGKYIKMLQEISELCHHSNLKLSVVVPFWLATKYTDDTNVAQAVANIADEIVSMSYRSDMKLVEIISLDLLNIADKSHTDIYLGVELMKIEDEIHTIYQVERSNSICLTANSTVEQCATLKLIRKFTLRGDSISFYKQLNKLNTLTKSKIDAKYLGGFILHHLGVDMPNDKSK